MSATSSLTAVLSRNALGLIGTLGSSRLSILIFHRVHAQADSLFPYAPDAARFEAFMQFVARTFIVMTLGEAVTHLACGRLPNRVLVITFDDGYADNAEVALPILQRHGLRATFFVSSGFLDGGRMWNDSVIESLRTCRHSEIDLDSFGLGVYVLNSPIARRQVIDALLPRIKYLMPVERDDAIMRLQHLCGLAELPGNLMMHSTQVRALHRAGMEIGGHTVNHPILKTLKPAEADVEIRQGRDHLQSIIDAPVEVFAFPNGKPGIDYDQSHLSLVKKLGFRGAVSTAPGVARSGDDLFQLPRFTPWGRTLPLLAARLVLNQWNTRFDIASGTG